MLGGRHESGMDAASELGVAVLCGSRVLAVSLHAQLEGLGGGVAAVGQHALCHGPAGLQRGRGEWGR